MTGNPILYTSRTYTTILNDIDNDLNLRDKPAWFKRMIAGLGDVLSMWENASANNSRLRTAFTRQAIKDQLQLIDYELTQQATSSGYCIFYLDTGIAFPVSFLATEMTAISQGNINVLSKRFEARTSETIASTTGTFTHANPDNYLTVATDFVYTGHKVRFTTTNTLPTGLSTGTDYYLVWLSATTVSVATSLANALAGTYIDLTAAGAGVGTHTWTLYSFAKLMYQQENKGTQIIGQSDGSTEFQIFDFLDKNVLLDTVEISVAASTYTKQTTLVNSIATDKDWKAVVKSLGSTACMFGNGTYGVIPPANDVYATYAVGGGTNSNVTTINKINIYSGGNSDITGVYNATTFTGGADEENTEVAKIQGPLLLKATNRFVTVEDGEALIYAYGGISLAQVQRNTYGALSCQVLGVASGGGNPGAALRTAIQTDLIDKSILSGMDVRFNAYTPKTTIVTSATKVADGYLYANIIDYITVAWKMLTSETGKEIIDAFNGTGIATAIALINSIFSTAFLDTESNQIMQIIEQLERVGYRDFNDSLQLSDTYSYIQNAVDGIDYITITLPAFPVTQATDEILTHSGSTYNLSEI